MSTAVLALSAGNTGAAMAAGPTFALEPASPAKLGYFVLSGRPNAKIKGKVRVINVGTKAGRTSLYAVDATTGQTSGVVYRSRQEPRRGVGVWIRLAKTTVRLSPGQSQVVPFTVRVPRGAAAGQHLGASSRNDRSAPPGGPPQTRATPSR